MNQRLLLFLSILVASSGTVSGAEKAGPPPASAPAQAVVKKAGPPESGRRKDLFPDPHSGERVLHEIFGTTNLSPLRKRAFEIGPREKAKERVAARRALAAGALADPAWTFVGPAIRQSNKQAGASESALIANMALHPTDPGTIWVATSGGGVWKTTDGGASWRPTMDDQAILPVGAVAVSPSQPQRVYAGVGNGDASSGSQQFDGGVGLLISSDGGETWRTSRTSPGDRFFELLVDPANPDVVLAATNRGVMRSADGGDTWTLAGGIPPTQAVSLSRAANPAIVFAGTFERKANGGTAVPGMIWKSTDGGVTFVDKSNGFPPADQRGRGQVAVAPSDPNRVYVLFTGPYGETLDMFRSMDGGDTWTALGLLQKDPKVDILSAGLSFNTVAVDPRDPNVVFAGGYDMWKTTDGGASWARVSENYPTPPTPYLHVDQHSINFASDGSIYFTTDGGIFKTTDGGRTIQSLNAGLATLQFYRICQTPLNGELVMGGAQDNGTSLRRQGTEFVEPGIGGDGFGCFISGTDANIMIGSAQNLSLARSTDGGRTFERSATKFGITDANESPFDTLIRRHPVKGDWAYTRSNKRLWVTKDNGASWTSPSGDFLPFDDTVWDLSLLGSDGSHIVVLTQRGAVFESVNDGTTWTKKGGLDIWQANAIRYDRSDVRRLFLVAANAKAGTDVDRVMLSTDGGATWGRSQTGLPELPVLTIEQDVLTSGTWYAGTYIGVYRSVDGGATWQRYGTGLPNAMVMDMDQLPNGRLRVGTFGRAIWEIRTSGAAAAPVASFSFSPAAPVAGQPVTFTDTSTGGPTSWAWTFGEGTSSTQQNPVKTFPNAGTFTVTLTATNADGSSEPSSRAITVATGGGGGQTTTLFVPVVLKSSGANNSFYTSEMTLTNRGSANADITFSYTATAGGGSGSGSATLAAGRQLIVPDAIDYLRAQGVPIPDSGNRVGTLRVQFSGVSASDVGVLVRTTTPVPTDAPTGAAGLAYAGVPVSKLPSGPVVLCGLRRDALDRTNIAVQNAGDESQGSITVRIDVLQGDRPYGNTISSEEVTLAPGGFRQVTPPEFDNGYARVSRTSGSAPYYAYAVINDNFNSDGSFVLPVEEASLGGANGPFNPTTLPVALEAGVFSTEVIIANLTDRQKGLVLDFYADALGAEPASAFFALQPGQQYFFPNIIEALRAVRPIPTGVVGPLFMTVQGGSKGIFVGARTGSPGGGGRYSLFYSGVLPFLNDPSPSTAWVNGLQQTGTSRSNVALVNTGEVDGSSSSFLIEIFDGDSARKAGETTVTVAAKRFLQISAILGSVAPGTTNAYARVTRTSGTNPFVTYGVINDGGVPGQRSGDGAFVLSE